MPGSPRRRRIASTPRCSTCAGPPRPSPATPSARRASPSRSRGSGAAHEAVRVLAAHERTDAPRLIGRVLRRGRAATSRPSRCCATRRGGSARPRTGRCSRWPPRAPTTTRSRSRPAAARSALGARDPELLVALATALYRLGEFVECEQVAQQLISDRASRATRRSSGCTRWRARSPGQGRHVDAHPYAKAAAELGPNGEVAAELIETMDRIVAQQTPPVRPSAELIDGARARSPTSRPRGSSRSIAAIASPSWGIARAALAACEFRARRRERHPGVAARARGRGRRARPHARRDHDRRRARADPRAAHPRQRVHPDRPAAAARAALHRRRSSSARTPSAASGPHRPSAILSFAR